MIRAHSVELEEVSMSLGKCAEPGRTVNEKRDLSQGAVETFFGAALRGTNLEIATGHRASDSSGTRKGTELDLVVDARGENRIHFGARSRHDIERVPVHAHLEVSHYSALNTQKIAKDLARLDRTIRDAARAGVKTWTGLAYLGPVDPDQFEKVRRVFIDHYHDHDLGMVATLNVGPTWPIVDVVVVPGRAWKKQEYYAEPSPSAEVLPGFHEIPTFSSDPLAPVRPLAVARHWFANFLRLERGEPTDTLEQHRGAVLGPPHGEFRSPAVVVLPCRDLEAIYRTGAALRWIEHVTLGDGPRCRAGKRHTYAATAATGG